jgi:asparagine synthetase B (glutamine-hydrolysing)
LILLQVVELAVHTKETAPVVFRAGKQKEAALRMPKITPLLAYFDYNASCTDPGEKEILEELKYVNMPELYLFDEKTKKWRPKEKCVKMTIGSLLPVSPKERECFFLRALLQKKTCPKSYEDLRTVDGVEYKTFREAAVALGLVRGDEEYRRFLHLSVQSLFFLIQ